MMPRHKRKRQRSMESPDFASAGAFIKSEIDRTGISIKDWSARHGLNAATVYRIVKGTYNFGQDCSISMLWRIARAIRPLSYDAQREFTHQVLQRAGMLPPPDQLDITYAMLELRRELSRLHLGVQKLESQDRHRERATLKRLRARDPGLADEVASLLDDAAPPAPSAEQEQAA